MSSSQFDQYGQHVESKHLRNGMDSDQYIKDNALYRTWLTHDLYLKKVRLGEKQKKNMQNQFLIF